MTRKVALIVTGVCMLSLLGCSELHKLRKQRDSLQSQLKNSKREKEILASRLHNMGVGASSLNEQLAKALEEQRKLTEALASFRELAKERQEQVKELKELVKDVSDAVYIQDRPEGSFIVMENSILFAAGKVDIGPDARKILDATVVTYMKRHPKQRIRIDGHTDGQPISASKWNDNYHLSAMRALGVMRYLVSRGISKEKMHVVGFGMNQPLKKPTRSEDPVAENRRVEILLVPEAGRGIEDILEQFQK